MISTKKVALSTILIALTIVLSPIYFPVSTTKCYPFQHMINAISGVILGPWYAAFMAVATGTIRNIFNVGTPHAFPGGIPGGLVVGLVYRYLRKRDYAAFTEPLGTVVIGATISALFVAPWLGRPTGTPAILLYIFWVAFAASSIPGSALGFIVIKILRRSGIVDRFI